jgi:uncharacterized repeat protein (TIGR01451 family)
MKKIYLFLAAIFALLASNTNAAAQTYTIIADSVNADTSCSWINLDVTSNVYTVGQKVLVLWGDATVDTVYCSNAAGQGHIHKYHSYALIGTYSIKSVLINANIHVDSATISYTNNGCYHLFSIGSYNDLNTNCAYDLGDIPNNFPLTIEVDSNNVPIDTVSTPGLNIYQNGPPGTIYQYKVIATPAGMLVTCPVNGIILDTVSNLATQTTTKYFGINCTAVPVFDLAENVSVCVSPYHGHINIDLTNTDCNGTNATLVVNLSPNLPFDASYPPPTTIVGNTLTYNLTVASIYPQYITIVVDSNQLPLLAVGDTFHTSYYLTPTVGDTDITNNTVIRVDTVHAAFDPNYKDVTPQGDIAAGDELKYTINFENTGNDTAHNIYILDTLSDNLDPNTLKIVTSTATVYTQVLAYGTHHLVRFNFPGIMLPDSSHHGLCDGNVVFTIQSKTALAPGTYIPNKAGIYFDYNPVVMTNEVVNRIPLPQNVSVLSAGSNVLLYPNPVSDILTISADAKSFSSIEISNTIGQLMLKQSIKQNETKVNVKALPGGIYFATMKGEGGSRTIKFEKL